MHRTPILIFGIYLICIRNLASSDELQVHCVTESAFAVHITIFNQVIDTPLVLNCPSNHECVPRSRMPCQAKKITSTTFPSVMRPTTTTTDLPQSNRTTPARPNSTLAPTIHEPECYSQGYHKAGKCNEYYECVQAFWWFKATLRTCAPGYFYSETKKPCDKPPNVFCYY